MTYEPILTARTKFTEGPWRAEWGTDNEGDPYFDICSVRPDADDDGRLQDYGGSIVEAAYPVIQDQTEAKANAELIATAPEMFCALAQALNEEAHGSGCKAVARSRPNACDCWLTAARYLVALHRGEVQP